MVKIIKITNQADIEKAKRLFIEMSSCLDFAALFLDIQNEISDHPSHFEPPRGCIHLAEINMHIVGCSIIKEVDEHKCELKRLYVLPGFRKKGIGKLLAKASIEEAHRLGYKIIQLITMPYMKNAIELYRKLGFKPVQKLKEAAQTSSKELVMHLDIHDLD